MVKRTFTIPAPAIAGIKGENAPEIISNTLEIGDVFLFSPSFVPSEELKW
jgi:hypothetical protein